MRLARRVREWWQGRGVRIDPDAPDTVGGMMVLHETENNSIGRPG